MKKLIFIFAMLIALNLDLLASETITLGDTLWCRKTANIESVAFHPNSKYIATGSDDDVIRVWDVETGTISHTFTSGYSVNFSDSGNYLYSESTIINCNTWKIVGNIAKCGYSDMSSDEKLIASIYAADEMAWLRILIYNVKTMELIKDIKLDTLFPMDGKGNRNLLQFLKFTKDGKYLLFSSSDKIIRKIDLITFKIETLSTLGWGPMAISNDGKLLAFCSKQENIAVEVMNLETNQIINEFGPNPNALNVAFSPDNNYIAYTLGATIRIWNIITNSEEYIISPNSGLTISISNSNKYIATNGAYYLLLYPTPWSSTSVKDPKADTTILYPNPTSNIITLQTTITNNNNIIANIYDAQSNLVLNKIYNNLKIGLQYIEIDVSSLSNGIYYLQLISNNITTTYKIIINK